MKDKIIEAIKEIGEIRKEMNAEFEKVNNRLDSIKHKISKLF